MKVIKEYDVDEVAIWLNCIGLGAHIGPFRDIAVDGDMLTSLTLEDLTGDLGLSHLQAKKLLHSLEFTVGLTGGGGAGGGGDDAAAKVKELEAENAQLKEENAKLKASLQGAQAQPVEADTARHHAAHPVMRAEVRHDVRRDIRHDERRRW